MADLADFPCRPHDHAWQDLRMHYVDEGPRDAPVMPVRLHAPPPTERVRCSEC